MLHLTLYKYANKPIIVDKSSYLGTGLAVTGDAMTSNQDMENPVVLLSYTTEPDYNYAYIQEYHRYYYLTQKTWVSANVWSLTFHVDELYTYKTLVKSLSGLVAYSASGSSLKPDSRLVYNNPPTYSTNAPASTLKNPGDSYILLRCRYFNVVTGLTTPDNNMIYYVMPISSFRVFQYNYNILANGSEADQKLAVAIGKLIVDCTVLKWFKASDYTAVTTGSIPFQSPEIDHLRGMLGGYSLSMKDANNVAQPYYGFFDHSEYKGVDLTWLLVYQYYWQRKASRVAYIPFVGRIALDLERMGISSSLSSFVGVHIDYDFSSNSYVIVPGTATIAHGAESLETLYYGYAERVPNMFSTAYVVDESMQMWETALDRQYTSGMLGIVGNIPNAAAGFMHGSLVSVAAQYQKTLNDIKYTETEMNYAQAASLATRGTDNGGCIDNAYITIDNNTIVNIDAFLEVYMSVPSTDFASFWADHGLPDGAHRSLSGLTGYVQMQEFEMLYDSNATVGEMQRLEAQLYKGVIL